MRVPRKLYNAVALIALVFCTTTASSVTPKVSSIRVDSTCGNVDGDSLGTTDYFDLFLLSSYLGGESSLPVFIENANVDECYGIDIADLVQYRHAVFESGEVCPAVAVCTTVSGVSISLDSVSVNTQATTLPSGRSIAFYLRIENLSGVHMEALANGLRLYSPDGANWVPQIAIDTHYFGPPPEIVIDTTLYSPAWIDPEPYPGITWKGTGFQIFDGAVLHMWSSDHDADTTTPDHFGSGSDTLWFFGWKETVGTGVFDGFVAQSWSISIDSFMTSSVGKTFCIDSCFYKPAGTWKWAGWDVDHVVSVYPTWSGPHCFTIGTCCSGIRGNFNLDPAEQVDIGDLTALIGWMFKSGNAPLCMLEADVDGNGDHDIADVTSLVGYMFKGGPEPAGCP